MENYTVKFCENNFPLGSEEVANRIRREMPDVDVEVEFCLEQCGLCAEKLFALVNEEVVEGDTPYELYEEIQNCMF